MSPRRLLPSCLLLLPCLLLTAAAPAPIPRRIVSLNMCADQLLIALADRGQVAALTEWARDPSLSYYAARAATYRTTRRTAEEVIALNPDLIVGAPFRTKGVLAPLKARGVAMLDMPKGEGFDGIVTAVRAVAKAVGHVDRGERLIATMRAELAAVGPPPGRGRVAAYYQRGGYLTGTGTLVDEAMARVGLVNLAGRLGASALSQLSLEQLVLARPAFIVSDTGTLRVRDRGSAMLHHPLLASSFRPEQRLHIPQALTVCGGPGYPRAVAMLAAQVRRADAIRR